ncbi:MAG: sulfotransferase domain-containing protein [Candidatus Aureabacteria bacterium]|nr:sulfotransferase domain-containing protein [Candidatus Auribacterota bacterium]
MQINRKKQKSAKTIMRPVFDLYRKLRYESFLWRLGVKKEELLILATITKTGTHYMRFLFANYLKQLDNSSNNPAGPFDIDDMFPNGWHLAYLGGRPYKKPTPLLNLLGLHDMPRSHIDYQEAYWKNSRVLHLYRNPLDYAVFLYIFKYQYYKDLAGTVSGPVEVLNKHFEDYIKMYLSYCVAAKANSNTKLLSISYEDLSRQPQVCLRTIIRWLGFEPDPYKVDLAVQYSSEQVTSLIGAGERWQRDNTVPANPSVIEEFINTCINEGSIGQWKKYFNSSDVRLVQDKLNRFGVDLYDFVLEP